MDSSSIHPQEEAKGDEIPSNNDQQNNQNNDSNLNNSEQNNNNTASEDNKLSEEEKGQVEEITNSIANNLLPSSIGNESNENKIENNPNNDGEKNSESENKDDNNDQNNEKEQNDNNLEKDETNNNEIEQIEKIEKEETNDEKEKTENETNNENRDNASENEANNEKEKDENETNKENEPNEDLEKNETNNESEHKEDENNEDKDKEKENNDENKTDEENKKENAILHFSQTFSDEDVQHAFDQMYENGKTPETSMFPQLLQVIYREKANAIDNQNYDRAKKLENMITSINRENDSYSYSYSMTPESQNRYLNDRDSRLQQQLKDTNAKYKVKLDHHTEDSEARMRQLQEKQQQEVDELKAKYQDPSFLKRFNRPSQQLISMRKCERKLALARKYEEARQMKRLADNQQRREEKEMHDAAQQSMQQEYAKLIEKQKKDMDKLLQFDQKMEKEIKVKKQKEISPIKKAIRQTAIRKINNEVKRPAFYPISSSALSSPFSYSLNARNYNPELARDTTAKNQSLATPRTLQKIKLLKDQNKVELNIEPIDNSTFAKLEQMNARRVKSLLPKL